MICAQSLVVSGATVVAPVATPPADLSACELLVLSGSDLGVINAMTIPPAADLATVWGVSFTLVVGCYLIGWMAGTVVDFVRR